MKLKDKYAIVTGAGKGIGKSIAIALMENDVNVFGISRTKSDLESIKEKYSKIFDFAVGDITDMIFLNSIKSKFQDADILINNAGFGIFKPFQEMETDEFRSVLETNLIGSFSVAKLAIPYMIKNNHGAIVNISSLAGQNTFERGSAYCASKFGLNALSDCMMLDLRKHNIKVITVSPGTVITDFSDKGGWNKERIESYPTADDIAQIVIDSLKLDDRCLVSKYEIRPTNPIKK
ncbi:MAG: SDR family NAD(P)-dependent oxidoreductase [candidate division Zixibacteria bacterium]|nr:SDR family NAD(P)-dependent oxidoreductase [candidate division Zixibacteria bacterium]